MKLLLHTCCAPCSVYCIKSLRDENIEPTLFFYNPNIHPMQEYIARRDCLKVYAKKVNVSLIVEDEYGLDEFVCNINKSALDDLSKRCEAYCYPLRLRKLCEYAKANNFDTVSTTLLYSIYQKHDFIAKLLEELATEYNLTFLYRDFREGWRYGQDEARAAGLYMQKYCGCVYSEEESTFAKNNKKLFKELNLKPTNENARRLIEETTKN